MTSSPLHDVAPRDRVVIAGGGIGGIATALALALNGIPSIVLERRLVFGDDGAGIQIGPNGTRILERLGAAPFLQARVTAPNALRILEAASARELATFPLGRWMALRHGAPYWVAHRRDLHAALHMAAERQPLITLRMAFDVRSIHDDAGGVAACSADGDVVQGSAVIAADGAWSLLRARAFGGGIADFTGKTAARAVVPIADMPDSQLRNRTEVHLWLGPDVHVVHYPVSSGYAVAIVAVFNDARIPNDWATRRERSWMMDRAGGYAPLLRDLLSVPDHWRSWPLVSLTRPPPFAQGRLALLGDAAHPVLPFLAQGGVMALEDAVVIADALAANRANPAEAFIAYERARRDRVLSVAAASRRNGRIYHLAGLAAAARNFGFAHVPGERFMSRFDWLYGWQGP